jgi:5-aminopentanamidase
MIRNDPQHEKRMAQTVTVAVAQVPVVLGDVRANLGAMAPLMAEAASRGAKLVVFPECYLTGYMFDDRAGALASAVGLHGAELGEIASRCTENDLEVVVGFLEAEGDRLHNSAAVLGPSGLIGVYRKRHLPHLGADRFVDEPEETAPSLFQTRVGLVGVAICYEIRFPEVMRTLALEGADIIALPTNWPVQSFLLAECFTRVRAAENLVHLLVANRADVEGDARFSGQSQIIDPLGNVVGHAGVAEGLLLAGIDVERARDKRIIVKPGEFELSPWADRRPATYRLA